MPRITDFGLDSMLNLNDKLLGSTTTGQTRNYELSQLADFFSGLGVFNPPEGIRLRWIVGPNAEGTANVTGANDGDAFAALTATDANPLVLNASFIGVGGIDLEPIINAVNIGAVFRLGPGPQAKDYELFRLSAKVEVGEVIQLSLVRLDDALAGAPVYTVGSTLVLDPLIGVGQAGGQGTQGVQGFQGQSISSVVAVPGALGQPTVITIAFEDPSGETPLADVVFNVAAGVQGEQGDQGDQGIDGFSISTTSTTNTGLGESNTITITSNDPTVIARDVQVNAGVQGVMGLIGETGNGGQQGDQGIGVDTAAYTPVVNNVLGSPTTINIPLTDPSGDTTPTPITFTIPSGIGGADGVDGGTLLIANFVQGVGAVPTTFDLVVNSGEPNQQTQSYSLPRGLQGVGGSQGVPGTPGAPGTDGIGIQGDGWTSATYSSTTGMVTFLSDDGLGFSTGDLRGSNGLGWTAGAYADTTGVVTFSSADGLSFATGDLRGAQGPIGPAGNGMGPESIHIGDANIVFTNAWVVGAIPPSRGTFDVNNIGNSTIISDSTPTIVVGNKIEVALNGGGEDTLTITQIDISPGVGGFTRLTFAGIVPNTIISGNAISAHQNIITELADGTDINITFIDGVAAVNYTGSEVFYKPTLIGLFQDVEQNDFVEDVNLDVYRVIGIGAISLRSSTILSGNARFELIRRGPNTITAQQEQRIDSSHTHAVTTNGNPHQIGIEDVPMLQDELDDKQNTITNGNAFPTVDLETGDLHILEQELGDNDRGVYRFTQGGTPLWFLVASRAASLTANELIALINTGGTSIDQARLADYVEDWAQNGNIDTIPYIKLPRGSVGNGQTTSVVSGDQVFDAIDAITPASIGALASTANLGNLNGIDALPTLVDQTRYEFLANGGNLALTTARDLGSIFPTPTNNLTGTETSLVLDSRNTLAANGGRIQTYVLADHLDTATITIIQNSTGDDQMINYRQAFSGLPANVPILNDALVSLKWNGLGWVVMTDSLISAATSTVTGATVHTQSDFTESTAIATGDFVIASRFAAHEGGHVFLRIGVPASINNSYDFTYENNQLGFTTLDIDPGWVQAGNINLDTLDGGVGSQFGRNVTMDYVELNTAGDNRIIQPGTMVGLRSTGTPGDDGTNGLATIATKFINISGGPIQVGRGDFITGNNDVVNEVAAATWFRMEKLRGGTGLNLDADGNSMAVDFTEVATAAQGTLADTSLQGDNLTLEILPKKGAGNTLVDSQIRENEISATETHVQIGTVEAPSQLNVKGQLFLNTGTAPNTGNVPSVPLGESEESIFTYAVNSEGDITHGNLLTSSKQDSIVAIRRSGAVDMLSVIGSELTLTLSEHAPAQPARAFPSSVQWITPAAQITNTDSGGNVFELNVRNEEDIAAGLTWEVTFANVDAVTGVDPFDVFIAADGHSVTVTNDTGVVSSTHVHIQWAYTDTRAVTPVAIPLDSVSIPIRTIAEPPATPQDEFFYFGTQDAVLVTAPSTIPVMSAVIADAAGLPLTGVTRRLVTQDSNTQSFSPGTLVGEELREIFWAIPPGMVSFFETTSGMALSIILDELSPVQTINGVDYTIYRQYIDQASTYTANIT